MSARDGVPESDPVRMTCREFRKLLEYSSTLPTGVVDGKRWRRHHPWRDPDGRDRTTLYVGRYHDLREEPLPGRPGKTGTTAAIAWHPVVFRVPAGSSPRPEWPA